jgi:hypothetical protein
MERTTNESVIEFIKKSNINPMLKFIYLNNSHLKSYSMVQTDNPKSPIKIKRKRSSVSPICATIYESIK